jgi:hypothetical protein
MTDFLVEGFGTLGKKATEGKSEIINIQFTQSAIQAISLSKTHIHCRSQTTFSPSMHQVLTVPHA